MGTYSEAQTWHMSDLHRWREQREPRPDASPITWVEWTEHECSLGHSEAEVRRHTHHKQSEAQYCECRKMRSKDLSRSGTTQCIQWQLQFGAVPAFTSLNAFPTYYFYVFRNIPPDPSSS